MSGGSKSRRDRIRTTRWRISTMRCGRVIRVAPRSRSRLTALWPSSAVPKACVTARRDPVAIKKPPRSKSRLPNRCPKAPGLSSSAMTEASDQCQSISMPAHHLLPSGANHRVNPDPAGTASPARSRNPAADLSFLRLTGWPEAAQELVPHGREDGRPVGVGTVEFDRVTKVPRPDDKALVDDMRPFALKDIVELPDGRVIAAVGGRLDADLLIGRVGLRSVRGLLPPVGELIGLWMRGPGDHHHEPPVRASELDLGSGPGTHLPAGRQAA